jgi:diadenosine tetraphosphatase ApaH/serine/threonine PP2A family protein phosphatase
LIADVHANLTALEAVFAALPAVDEIWALGDHVGYGPDPSEVLALLRERRAFLVAGNHDRAVGAGEGTEAFPNRLAAMVAAKHREWLSAEERDHLAALPLVAERGGATLFHGSLAQPLTEYVFDSAAAQRTLRSARTALCCNGHTHIAAVFELAVRGGSVIRPDAEVTYSLGDRTLVNPGSVGQPRDGDPRAAWALLEPTARRVTFHRTAYDVAKTQSRMREKRLPQRLIDRLASGI